MLSILKQHQAEHDNLHLDCPEEDCEYWTILPHYLRDHLTRYHDPLMVCELSLNGCPFTICARSSCTRHDEYCKFKPFSTKAEDDGSDGGNEKEGEGGNDGEDGNDGDN